jgi:hypothetical protein
MKEKTMELSRKAKAEVAGHAPQPHDADPTARPSHHHGAEAGAIAGEVVGAVLGSAAGPPGVVAGMVLGAAAGALAGEVLDQDAERASRHDHDLDDEIGVTKGDLGRPPARTTK